MNLNFGVIQALNIFSVKLHIIDVVKLQFDGKLIEAFQFWCNLIQIANASINFSWNQNVSNKSFLFEVESIKSRELHNRQLNRVVIQDGPHAGMDEQVLVHTRSIGDMTYPVKKNKNLWIIRSW